MVLFSFNEKKGSRLRISRGFKRLVGEVARFFRVLTAEARTYRIFGAVRRVEIVEVSRERELMTRGEREELESREEMLDRAESCTDQ